MNELAQIIATVFGIGRLRPAPGTIASLAALPAAFCLALLGNTAWDGRGYVLLAGIAALAAGAWACEIYCRETGKTDPSECVIDEVAGQWIACAFAPLSLKAYAVAFLFFRAFDIAKPWPISRAEQLHGGIGVMADDLLAGLAAGFIVAALAHLGIV